MIKYIRVCKTNAEMFEKRNSGFMRNYGMSKFEKKFGKYAIPNLSLILVMCYVAGYVIQLVNPNFLAYLSLDPYQILHGQVWRVFTWLIIPPSNLDVFTIITLFFYYSIGTALEQAWGTYRYNVYIWSGVLITIVSSFLAMGICYWGYGPLLTADVAPEFFNYYCSRFFSTYYVNMSIFMAYALTYPEHRVLLMFIVPVKVKWLGIIYGVLMAVSMVEYLSAALKAPEYWFGVVAIAASLINFVFFWISSKRLFHLAPKQIKRRSEFKHQVREASKPSVCRCSICGRTETENPELEFRYCSKCEGSYAYCQEHLFTHVHKVRGTNAGDK